MPPYARVIAVIPAHDAKLHWVYLEDGTVYQFSPDDGMVHSVVQLPADPRQALVTAREVPR